MKVALSVVSLFILTSSIFAQNRPEQNIRRNVVTSRYEIVDGKRTSKSYALYQVMYDSLGRGHTIFEWDYPKPDIKNHTLHTFRGNLIEQTWTYRNKNLCTMQFFTYTADSLLKTETIKRVAPGDTALYVTLTYTYSNRKPVQIDALAGNGKRAWRTKSVFDAHGTEVKRTVKPKGKFYPLDSIINLTCTPKYDSLGRKVAETITKKLYTGKQTVNYFKYEIDDKGLLTGITETDKNGNTLYRIKNEYASRKRLKFISRFNANDVLVDFQAIRYELYPTADRRGRIIEF